jgi:bacteriocin-like protein
MSEENEQLEDEELAKVTGGVSSHPLPRDPIRPKGAAPDQSVPVGFN